jgi:hypothetical protein
MSTPRFLQRFSFVPRSDSKVVFILVMVCFTYTVTALLLALVHAFRLPAAPPGLFRIRGNPILRVCDLLGFAPIFESLMLIAVIELLRWVHGPLWLQISGAALVIGAMHSALWRTWGLVVAPAFAIDAFSYVYWRSSSRKIAFVITACIHSLHNLTPAISVIAYATRKA